MCPWGCVGAASRGWTEQGPGLPPLGHLEQRLHELERASCPGTWLHFLRATCRPATVDTLSSRRPFCSSSLSIHAPPFLSLLSSLFPNLVFEFHSLQGFFDVIDKTRGGETASCLSVNSLFMHLEAKGVLSDSLWSSQSGCCPRARGGDKCWAGPLCCLGMAVGGQGQSWPTRSLSGCLGR